MDYFRQVQDAIAYIEEHLSEEIILQEVADHVGYSAFHFCRLFQGITGESVMDYVRKRRLTQAAESLVQTRTRILDIAVNAQYDSQEAFSRSFKRAYGMTPGQYRRRGAWAPLREPLLLPPLFHHKRGDAMEPKIVELGAMTVVGMEYVGKNENMEIPALWNAFNPHCQEIQHKTHPNVALGVCGEMRADGSFSYVAGFQVDAADDVPFGMVVKHIPPAKYAVFTHHGQLFGTEHDLSATYGYIYREWLPNSPYERADTPDFELYDERFTMRLDDPDSEIDIYIPIQ